MKHSPSLTRILITFLLLISPALAFYTTEGQNIIDRSSGETVILRGFGLGGWLLPEGYMWGIRTLDRPRQFENAIEELIGEADAEEFWRLYRDNFLIEEDVAAMKNWGVNTLRVALLASMLQPRELQTDQPPYVYSENGFHYLDQIVAWCEKYEIGLIWDMHGAPGAQNAENIADSDGEARLWTQPEKYWPRCIDLWRKIAERYKDSPCITGYDLLNEPLLRRYDGIDPALLRELYVKITHAIRSIDQQGIIFIEGDDWAQEFKLLEPLDWDPHLVITFHSYPPTSSGKGLKRWDDLRQKYDIPLWHGETGEQGPPYTRNELATHFLEQSNVGWSWWTHKKFDRLTQPWTINPTDGFTTILNYWKGMGEKPAREQARDWLFEQARRTHTDYCIFLPEMVRSLVPLSPDGYLSVMEPQAPKINRHPQDAKIMYGDPAVYYVRASGYPLQYQWYINDQPIPDQHGFLLIIPKPELEMNMSLIHVVVSNERGSAVSEPADLEVMPYTGPEIIYSYKRHLETQPWDQIAGHQLTKYIFGPTLPAADLSASFKILWNIDGLFIRVDVQDDHLIDKTDLDYERDGIEIYIDADNSKSIDYGDDEFLIRFNWNDPVIHAGIGEFNGSCTGTQTTLSTGYRMSLMIPWEVINGKGIADEFIGFDIHINDNDGTRRDAKLTWKATRDNSYQSPSYFGTMRLAD